MFGGQGGVQAFSNDPFDADDEMDDAIEMMREMMARMMGGAAYQPQHPAQAPVSVNAPSFANAPAAVSAPSSAKAAAKTAAGQAPARPMGRSLVNSGVSSTYIQDKNNEYVIQLNMPGMQKSDIKTEVRNNMLTVSAVSKSESSQNGSGYSGASYCSGSFSASMSLPEDANSDKMKVDYNNDILTITIPKV
jgi:HSP20 family molecular chaperone IbpA